MTDVFVKAKFDFTPCMQNLFGLMIRENIIENDHLNRSFCIFKGCIAKTEFAKNRLCLYNDLYYFFF